MENSDNHKFLAFSIAIIIAGAGITLVIGSSIMTGNISLAEIFGAKQAATEIQTNGQSEWEMCGENCGCVCNNEKSTAQQGCEDCICGCFRQEYTESGTAYLVPCKTDGKDWKCMCKPDGTLACMTQEDSVWFGESGQKWTGCFCTCARQMIKEATCEQLWLPWI